MTDEGPTELPLTCNRCKRDGYFLAKQADGDCFVICSECQSENADVWCEACGMAGPFINNLHSRPFHWKCPQCKNIYTLHKDFYEHPHSLVFTQDPTVIDRRLKLYPGTTFNKKTYFLTALFILLAVSLGLVRYFL